MPKQIAFLTKHGKELIVAPILKASLSLELVHTFDFDTDKLGTFDHEIKRTLSAKDTALKKAHLACKLTGLSAGLGSEGSFNQSMGLGVMDQEILAFVDLTNNIEIIAWHSAAVSLSTKTLHNEGELVELLRQFPNQAWHIAQSGAAHAKLVEKGVVGISALKRAFETKAFPQYLVPDFRSMHCPERQRVIAGATRDLVERINAHCPNCGFPDFFFEHEQKGLPCGICEAPTQLAKAIAANCGKCGHKESRALEQQSASSFYCSFCNP
ncbi:DUF6671 family protein [Ningiella sp. W23]|uniref:DUF6671 family protein n=1 Tax=Ningiella sp. W23 TaxID=3023715 RepID=UPI003756E6F6